MSQKRIVAYRDHFFPALITYVTYWYSEKGLEKVTSVSINHCNVVLFDFPFIIGGVAMSQDGPTQSRHTVEEGLRVGCECPQCKDARETKGFTLPKPNPIGPNDPTLQDMDQ